MVLLVALMIEENTLKDILLLVPKKDVRVAN